ncbi:LysR family transcriptional regulator [Rhodobacteraceae bacterium B1Z28]|uniref:LysR family transcriptional regulator n=1 Tax=Ruegeria haliotis TaxID=2747601 RepID=A0ABX2PRA4_9RHOB|nr:LysR substrate-binding domain-containing protein [Ruegeria haliotis]NVO56667.1 LysR family transcriptional regulator [Ruegeria haliotis]
MSEFRRNLPPIGQLIAFEAAARLGNFTRASEELHMSQAAISRQIRELEKRLSASLFRRGRHEVSLTRSGELFLKSVRPALQMMLGAVEETRALSQARNEFVVYSDQSIDSSYLLPRLRRFLDLHPEVELKLISTGKPIEEVQSRFHIAFQAGPVWPTSYETHVIADDEVFPVCSPGFLTQHPSIVDPDHLATVSLLHFEQPGRHWTSWEDYLGWLGCDVKLPRKQIKFTRYPTLLHAAENGDGIALGWQNSVSSRLTSGTLVRVGTTGMKLKDYLHSYIRKDQPRTSLAVEFLEWLRRSG